MRMILFTSFFITIALMSRTTEAKPIEIKEDCDIPTKELTNMKTKDVQECARACDAQTECLAFTYVSGWGKCSLKKGFKKTFTIKINSGSVNEDPDSKKRTFQLSKRADNSGKDLKQAPGIKNSEDCGKACINEPLCKAFAFIEGYDTCWLKKANGRTFSKIFYCGVKD